METNNPFASAGQPPLSNTSGLKQLPQLVEPVYTNNSLLIFPQQVKGLNSDMSVNGLLSPSIPTNPHGTFATAASTTSHPASNNFDYLWKFPKSPLLKDCHGPGLPRINGSTSSVSNGPFFKVTSQDTLANSSSGCLASLGFGGQDLCNFTNVNVTVEAAANGSHCYSKASNSATGSIFGASNSATGPIFSAQALSPAVQCQSEQEDMDTTEAVLEVSVSSDVHPDALESHEDTKELNAANARSAQESVSPAEMCAESTSPEPSVAAVEMELEPDNVKDALQSDEDTKEHYAENEISAQESVSSVEMYSESANPEPSVAAEVVEEEPEPKVVEDTLESDEDTKKHFAENAICAQESVSSVEMYVESATPEPSVAAEVVEEELEPEDVKGTPGRRRVATPEEVRRPLLHGWKREVRISKGSHRWQGETWYYAPCGKRMKQFPEVIKYLSKHTAPHVRREHFSFSPRMPVGDFYEERHTPEGQQWVLLSSEEIPSRILAITGKRGRPRNLEKAKAKENKIKRGRGRPPKVKMIDLLNKADAKLLRKLENQDILSDVEKVQLSKLRKKMRRKARNQEAKQEAAMKLKLRERKEKEKEEREQKARDAELMAERKAKEAELIAERRAKEAQHTGQRRTRRQRAKPLQTSPVVQKPDRKQLAEQRRLEERKRQQFMLEELKKPTEDMCLPDHQPLPDFPRVPGLVLPSDAFFDCLMIVEFLYAYGKVFGLNDVKEIPSLYLLQEGLFNVGESQGKVQDLLIKLLQAALFDPGLPSYCQSLKILGEKVSEIILTRENVSEVLRIFLEAYGGDIELCESLRAHPFQAHPPHIKAAVLGFIVNELNGSTRIISEIDKTLENLSNYRKNKWVIEGKLRRLKFALGKKTAAMECPINNPDENHKSHSEVNQEVTEAEPGLLTNTADDEELSLNGNILDLKRQIEKLTKRQVFLRKKIIGCTQRLRSASLGQDRYRRFYWMLPHIGGIFVRGYSEGLGQMLEPPPTELPEMAFVKSEAVEGTEEKLFTSSRLRGRPRKSQADLEHCTFCQCPGPQEMQINGLLPHSTFISEQLYDGGKTAVFSWLTQCQNAIMNSTVLTPENSPLHSDLASTFEIGPCPGATDTDEKENKLYNLHPKTYGTDHSQKNIPHPNRLLSPPSLAAVAPPSVQVNRLSEEQHTVTDTLLPSASALCKICNKPIKNGTTGLHSSLQDKRRGRPSSKLFSVIEQKYYGQLFQRPIPEDKKQAWWWIKDPVMLEALIKALHPRGIREKALHKHLTKHLVHLKEMCSRTASDALFGFQPTEGHPVSQETLEKWSVEQLSFQADLSVLKRVEDFEQMVISSDLQLRGWFPSSLDSVRSDLKYFEHKVDASEDILAKVKKDVRLHREPGNPLDIAVQRLLDLEQNVERRYMKEPLWVLSEVQHEKIVTTDPETMNTTEIQYSITPRLRLWRQTVERCRSSAQLHLCMQQLDKTLAWERSVSIVTCIYCRKGDNDESLLLCDSCDRGCHMYCHRPPITEIPEGDWFCRNCVSQQGESEYLKPGGSSRRAKKCVQRYEDNSPIKPRKKEPPANSQQSPAESPLAKKRRIGTRSQSPDLTFCEIILMEMESHQDAWPFLEPVNPRLVPGYRKIIKNPMDFSTMRNKLLNGGYSSCEVFAEDAQLVFSNCQLFNEDESDVGKAGLVLKKFFESRWEEFSQERENTSQ
ncbi:bromodomain adjacent to zinc finger domain protein 2A [Gastrophryne carolinensis]